MITVPNVVMMNPHKNTHLYINTNFISHCLFVINSTLLSIVNMDNAHASLSLAKGPNKVIFRALGVQIQRTIHQQYYPKTFCFVLKPLYYQEYFLNLRYIALLNILLNSWFRMVPIVKYNILFYKPQNTRSLFCIDLNIHITMPTFRIFRK